MLGSTSIAESIIHAGYLPFDDNCITSKHRGLFIDFDHHQVLGQVDNIVRQANRQLNSEDPISTDLYLEAFKKYADDHDVCGRLDDLKVVLSSMPLDRVRDCYNAIDRDVTRAMLHAEKVAKRPSGRYVWSPELRKHGLLTRYWRLRLRNIPISQISISIQIHQLRIRLTELNIILDDNGSDDSNYINQKWKSELKNLRKVRKAAYDYRTIHMDRVIQQYQEAASLLSTEDTQGLYEIRKKIKRVERIISNEQMRQPFRLIKSATKDHFAGGLTKLFVPTHAINHNAASRFSNSDRTLTRDQLWALARSDKNAVAYETILDCATMEDTLNDYNRSWFRQAADTPFGHGDFFNLVGFDGLTEEADAILNGDCIEYMGIPMSNELKVFLEECKRPKKLKEIKTTISDEDFHKTVQKWKESTSTSPSGRHLGHYKAAILDDDITHLHVDMLNIPIQLGFAPERWTHSVTPMIEKDEGKPFLTRLRIIHLFEADYNLFLKILFGRRMVSNGEHFQALNDQQHGSRPRRMTMDALFLARLEKDLIRQTKTNAAHMDNDATGCYDRIIVSLGMIACRRLGMPTSAIKCQTDALMSMKYAVKHVYGISDTEYSSTNSEPLFGTGQGSGASPAIWLSLVTVLLNAFDRLATEYNINGLEFHDPWNEISTKWHIGAFVDDTNQAVMDTTHSLTTNELIERLRIAGQLWENLLHISGGALNLSKCSWSLQFWEWKNGRPRLQPTQAYESPLLMTNGECPDANIIHRIDNNTAARNLGVYLNATGTFSHHAKIVKDKSDTLAHRLQSTRLSRNLSLIYYRTTFLPAIGYSLPVTSMTDSELQQIQTLMNCVVLNKLGYNKHYPRAAAFAPTQEFGTGLHDIRIEQGLAQIQALLNYIGTGHKVGQVMLISYRNLQIEAGVSFQLLEQPQTPLPYLTPCWLTSLRSFCGRHGITITVKANQAPQLSRIHDRFIMDIANSKKMSKQELTDINLVRIYLKVCKISDITNATGHQLSESVWRCQQFIDRRSLLTYPRQLEPTIMQRRVWRKLLRTILQPQAKLSQLNLVQPLGPWIAPSTMKWKYTSWDNNLYIQNVTHEISLGERCVAIHFPHQPSIPNEHNIPMYDILRPDWYAAQIPKQATPVNIQGQNIVTIHGATSQWPIIQEPPTNFLQWREQLPSAEKRLLTFVTYLTADSETQIRKHLVTSTATLYIGTDGGRKEGAGSFSWLICSTNREKLVCNSGSVDGWYKCQSSYRSELMALSSAMLFLDELSTFYELTVICNFHCLVDSTGAISTIEHTRDNIPTRHYPDHADIVSTLKDATQIISRSMCQHVKSHQDDKKAYSELPFNAQVNVLCDRMATRHMKVHCEGQWASQQNFYITRNQPVVLSYMRRRIPSHYIKRLREAISSKAHRQYLQQRYNWDDQVWSTIAWESLYTIGRRSTKKPCFVNRTKLVHNWLNLGSQRAKFHVQSTVTAKQCPYCQHDETFIHLLTCNDPRAKKCRFEASTNLRKGLKSIPGGSTLLQLINTWIQHPTFHPQAQAATLGLQRSVDQAVASQSRIGWDHLFRGILSSDWGFIIPDDDTSMTPHMRRSNAKLHLSSLIQTLQNYALEIWAGRNTMLHSNSVVPISIREAKVNSEISALYDIHHTFTTRVQFYFRQPLDILIRAPYRTRQRWLIITKLATSQQQRPLHGQSQLTSYNFSLQPEFQFTSTPRTSSETYITPPDTRDDNIQTRVTQFFLPQ
jgi:Reverse transcriptase (RNA-dependent DNA polymerase)